MTNLEKQELRNYAKQGYSFNRIRLLVDCADSTIKRYIKTFAPKSNPRSKLEQKEATDG